MAVAPTKGNIVMFPFMAQGHIIPFLALALKLEQEKGYTITFVNTPLNIKKLQHSLPQNSSIRLLEIPYNSTDHGLPPNSESTETLPLFLMFQFIESSTSLKPAFTKLISNLVKEQHGHPPLCIISDMFFGWSAVVAHQFGASHAIFNAGGGYGMAVFHTTWLNLPHLKENLNSDEFSLPGFPEGYSFNVNQLPEHMRAVTGPWNFVQTMFKDWLESDAMLFNTVEEIDHTGLNYFRKQYSCSVWAVGPILSSVGSKARGGKEAEAMSNLCMKWLDSKPENSVLYVAFGSQNTPSEPQIKQLAMALEASGKNFLWVFRPPSSFVMDSNNKDNEECHCGWNSVIEALSHGVPMLSWPMGAEQPFNAKMLEEEIGVSVGVAYGNDCEVRCEDIVRKIELVMDGTETGKDMKRKACGAREMIKNATIDKKGFRGSSVGAMDEFLLAVLQMRKKLWGSSKWCSVR
ncbi:unnamed protein product [Ilex paraguariensis]|uniref:Glycosyltransferase n=1 Tax=Ilex paraguariensis TaxID=185542 RepID=A0ABC8RT64_9AQUA